MMSVTRNSTPFQLRVLFVILAVLLAIGTGFAIDWYRDRLILDTRVEVLSSESMIGASLTSSTNRRLTLLQGLRAFVLLDLELLRMDSQFEPFASILQSSMEGIRTLTISPSGIHEYVYPLEGNEGVLGHNLMTDERPNVRDDVTRAIETGEISLSGPYELRQGGLGLVARQAIHQDGRFWGFIALVVDVEPLLAEAGLAELPSHLRFALVDSKQQLIAGDSAAVQGSSGREILLPDGLWTLHVAPAEGWSSMIRPQFLLVALPTVFGACLLLLLLYVFMTRQVTLSRLVVSRTQRLSTAESRWRSLVEDSPDHVLVLGLDLTIESANHASPGLTVADLIGRHLYNFAEPPERDRVRHLLQDVLRTGVASRYETTYSIENRTIYYESRVSPRTVEGRLVGLTVISRDISLLKKTMQDALNMEEHLRQAQKLESVGTLASGVAHEINNPLMGMMNYAELVKDRTDNPESIEFLDELLQEGTRIAQIVRNLLSFSRQDNEEPKVVGIAEILESALSLVGSLLQKDQITVELDIPNTLPDLACRGQQIQQVVINLLTNARDALNERFPSYDEDKIIRIEVRAFRDIGENWIRFTIEDHGAGIPPEAIGRIFDPFFTTKPRTEGTGLGLSVSFGIVSEHQGRLTAESIPGEHTRFHMDLPVPD